MFKKSLILCAVFAGVVNCSSDKKENVVKSIPSDTPTEIINDNGEVVDTITPVQNLTPTPSVAEITKGVWTESGFTKEFMMSELIGADICALGEKQYVGCFFAARSLISIAYGPNSVLVVNGQKNEKFIGKKIKDLGLFAVYEMVAPSFKQDDVAAASEYAKDENDFFKQTVKALTEQYDAKIKGDIRTQATISNYREKFPELTQKMKAASTAKDKVAVDKVKAELTALFADIVKAKKDLESTIFKDYIAIIDDAFEKTPATDRALLASEVYGAYLTHSADGHARLALHPGLQAMISSQALQQQLFGIGVQITQNESGIYFDPIEGSPAQAAGVQSNDRLIAINGVAVPSTLEEAIKMIKGPRDTEVSITVEVWATKKQNTVTMKRQPIQQKSYTFSKKVVGDKTVGILKIATFMDDQMAAAVREYVKTNDSQVSGWIMDLRNNPGGLVPQAVELSSVFLPKNSAVMANSTEAALDVMDKSTMLYTNQDQATAKEVIVLINGGSASASEIVSGVLQEYSRAIVVGQRTFGKGTMQRSNYEFHPDIPEYRVWDHFQSMQMTAMGPQIVSMVTFFKTVGRYFFPSGRTPEWVGVSPDLEVKANPDSVDMFSPREQDVFPFSFGELGSPWVQKRSNLMTKIQSCVNAAGESVKTWSGVESKKPFVTNYQMLYAYDAMTCI
jgi:C-terminal peptidase prc